ncbi:MAG: hypothetical protein LUG45_01435 [Clostridiales bacterium]|nr:hypothetical protein [Clostridiales bacterium]
MNELLSSLFDRNMKAEPSDEEYVGEDGLFYCKKCHTPTQCRVEIAGRQSIVSCMCSCAKEELDKYERELAEMNRRNHIYSLKANGIQERALYDWTFEKAADSPSIQMARRYVDSWPEVKKNNLGLLLWGDVGTGKSFTAACIANALLGTGVPVLMTNFSKILNQKAFLVLRGKCLCKALVGIREGDRQCVSFLFSALCVVKQEFSEVGLSVAGKML